MAEEGYLVCWDCRFTVSLGSAVKDENHELVAFNGLARWDEPLTQAYVRGVWRVLSQHVGHRLESIREFSPRFDELSCTDEEGEHEFGYVDTHAYAEGFPPWDLGTCAE